MLQARRATGISPGPSPNPPPNQNGPFEAPVNPPAGPPPQQRSLFASPPPQAGPPSGSQQRQPLPQTEEQDPFGDHNEHADDMPPPLSPSYGLPPSTVAGGKENDQGAVYRPGMSQAGSSYGNERDTGARREVRGSQDHDGEDEDVRRPVYRF